MKFFKNTLSIVLLFTINSISARAVGGSAQAPKRATQPQPIPARIVNQPPVQQPAAQKQSFRDLVAYVKSANNVWDDTHLMLRTDFITTVVQKARAAHLDDFQLEALLQTARDLHGKFSGNRTHDIHILQDINQQIALAATRQK
ncbi:MAG TPA: hypothetical protein VJJ26_04685 [Candidatus Babeliales bacterium]|nr:hypothetical protein [Candidatus Babeliales bacterium]